MRDYLGGNVICTLSSGVELSDLVDRVEESRVPMIFLDSAEVKTERVKLLLQREALNSIA